MTISRMKFYCNRCCWDQIPLNIYVMSWIVWNLHSFYTVWTTVTTTLGIGICHVIVTQRLGFMWHLCFNFVICFRPLRCSDDPECSYSISSWRRCPRYRPDISGQSLSSRSVLIPEWSVTWNITRSVPLSRPNFHPSPNRLTYPALCQTDVLPVMSQSSQTCPHLHPLFTWQGRVPFWPSFK